MIESLHNYKIPQQIHVLRQPRLILSLFLFLSLFRLGTGGKPMLGWLRSKQYPLAYCDDFKFFCDASKSTQLRLPYLHLYTSSHRLLFSWPGWMGIGCHLFHFMSTFYIPQDYNSTFWLRYWSRDYLCTSPHILFSIKFAELNSYINCTV